MAGVVVGMETDEITIKDPKKDLATDREDPNNRCSVVSIFLPLGRRFGGQIGVGEYVTYL